VKWNKFASILSANPWLQMFIGSPYLVSLPLNVPADEARRRLKEYVRTQFEYVSFRPFDQLDLSATNVNDLREIPHPTYRNVKFFEGTHTDYTVVLHIEGPDEPFERARHVSDVEPTIRDVIEHLVQWHSEGWVKEGCPLRLSAVVKRVSRGNDVTQVRRQHLEVYLFPANFDLEQFKDKLAA
jgi:hypothetical protein